MRVSQACHPIIITSVFISWAFMYVRFRYSGKNPMRFAVFWRISVRFCGFRTPLKPPLFIQHFCDILLRCKYWLGFILIGRVWQSSGVTARRKRQWLRDQWHWWTNWGGRQRRVWSYTGQDGRSGMLLINLQAFVRVLSLLLSFPCVTVSLVVNFSLTEYIESQIPPLFYGVSGEIIQGSDITGNQW